MGLIDLILPVVRKIAQGLEGSGLAAEAQTDVRSLEAIAAQHESALAELVAAHTAATEAKVASWLEERLQRYLPADAAAEVPADAAAEAEPDVVPVA